MDLFNKAELDRLIHLFAVKINGAGISGTISLVGGAALSMSYLHDRRATTDIDALLPGDLRIPEIIAEMAREEGLEVDEVYGRFHHQEAIREETRQVVLKMLAKE